MFLRGRPVKIARVDAAAAQQRSKLYVSFVGKSTTSAASRGEREHVSKLASASRIALRVHLCRSRHRHKCSVYLKNLHDPLKVASLKSLFSWLGRVYAPANGASLRVRSRCAEGPIASTCKRQGRKSVVAAKEE